MTCWIRTIPPNEAEGRLATAYDRVTGPDGQIDNILQAHSLRPHTLDGHMALYKNALHHSGNRLSKALLEGLGVYVSALNGCDYCVGHHAAGMRRHMEPGPATETLVTALSEGRADEVVAEAERPLYRYARVLTRNPAQMQEQLIDEIRDAGWDDGQILEANQVISYFAYANRTVLGLGVNADGEVLGLSPSDGGDGSWHHG